MNDARSFFIRKPRQLVVPLSEFRKKPLDWKFLAQRFLIFTPSTFVVLIPFWASSRPLPLSFAFLPSSTCFRGFLLAPTKAIPS